MCSPSTYLNCSEKLVSRHITTQISLSKSMLAHHCNNYGVVPKPSGTHEKPQREEQMHEFWVTLFLDTYKLFPLKLWFWPSFWIFLHLRTFICKTNNTTSNFWDCWQLSTRPTQALPKCWFPKLLGDSLLYLDSVIRFKVSYISPTLRCSHYPALTVCGHFSPEHLQTYRY